MGILQRNRGAALIAAAGLAIIGSSGTAWGLSSTIVSQLRPLGTCFVRYESSVIVAEVFNVGASAAWAGGTYYFGSSSPPAPKPPAISIAQIQSCGLTNITNFVQNGADAANAGADAYIGFSFRATDPADGLTYDYEYALSGVTNTQVIATKVLVPATPAISPDEALIAGLQTARMNQLILNQPDLTHFLNGRNGPAVSMSALDGTGDIQASFISGPFWGQLSASWADAGAADSQYVLGSVGGHRKIGENAAIGLMAQFDHIRHDDPLGRAKGDGWLIGPYVVAKVPEREIFFDARALWGRTDNEITATGNPTDDVDGIRSLIQIRASTRLDFGEVQIRPRIEIARARESTGTFIDGLGTPVAGVSSAINQAAAGVTVSRNFDTAGGVLMLSGALDGIWTNTTRGPDAAYEDGRARVAFGLNYVTDHAGTFSASAFFDGIAQDGYEGRGLSAAYNLRF